jgi:type IX secretion system PorP/SprF family membrane protein
VKSTNSIIKLIAQVYGQYDILFNALTPKPPKGGLNTLVGRLLKPPLGGLGVSVVRFGVHLIAGIICFAGIHNTAYAQDPTFSQYQGNELSFNPAYTGVAKDLHFEATYRTLWPNVPGKQFPGPLSSYDASFDMMLKINHLQKLGIGFSAGQDVEGQGYLTTTTYALPISYHLLFSKSASMYIGIRPSMNQINIDWSRFVFSDQLSPEYGIVQNTSYNQEQLHSRYYFNFDAGALARFSQNAGSKESYEEVGFAVANMVRPAISMTGGTDALSRLPMRYIISGRAAFKAKEKLFIGPLMLLEVQDKFFSTKVGVDFYYRPKNNSNIIPLTFGLYHRTGVLNSNDTRGFIAYVGHKGEIKGNFVRGKYATYSVGFSADLNYGGLNMQTYGAYELTVGFTIPTKLSLDYYDQQCIW